MLRSFVLTAIALFLLIASAKAQVVKGKVVDATTGAPIPHASIYLNGSSKGTTSTTQGEFILSTTESNIPLVVSCVGYQTETISDYTNKTLIVKLNPRAQVLREVVIGGMPREEQMKIFLTQFIGSNIKNCIISNPDDINLTYSKNAKTLEADASGPLIIHNKKLGYKITYFLSAFSHSPFETSIKGNYVFAEDTLGLKPAEVKRILKARDKIYFGSRMHFIRSLWASDLKKNKLTITRSNLIDNNNTNNTDNDKELLSALVKARNGEKFFSPSANVTIKYGNNDISYVTLQRGNNEALIAANGFHASNLIWSGKIGEQRIGDLLPFEFEPMEPLSNPQQSEDLSRQVISDPVFVRMIVKQDSFMKSHRPEKVYIHTDKSSYIIGDTIRLKAYLLNADYLTLTNRSGILYVELDDQEGKAAKRLMLPVTDGLAWCDIALDERDIPGGSYTLRAYTNWMRNFGEDYIYKKDIYVSPAAGNTTLVKAKFNRQDSKVEAALQFTTLDGKVVLLKDMELRVMEGRKSLYKNQFNTGMDGMLKVNFELPLTTANNLPAPITIQAKDVTKGTIDAATLNIPVILNKIENIDIQFMPEGGNMVAGIPTKIGFKAIGEDGIGVNVTGEVIDSDQKKVTDIATTHAGMGNMEFTPKAGETYTAKINGITKTYALPVVKPAGLALKVTPTFEDDSIRLTTTATPGLYKGPYYLIGQAREIICYAQVIDFNKGWVVAKAVPKEVFPTGVVRFTLFDASRQPLNERQVFINHNDQLSINVIAHKPVYGTRDSVALAIDVKDKEGSPIRGVFSLAVTDDSQVKINSEGSNLVNNLLLTSQLKGNIEDPGYYFDKSTPQKETELDNLMLTQGWIGYDWKEVFKLITPLPYQLEKEFTVKGKVTNAFNKPIEGSNVVLFGKNPLVIKDTLTNKDGEFVFKNIFPLDTAIYKLQARNKRGKEFNVGIEMEGFVSPHFTAVSIIKPWYVNTDTLILNNSKSKAEQLKQLANYRGEGRMLGEVTIKDKKIVKGSLNLNGAGEADQILDESEINKLGKISLAALLEQKIKGFRIGSRPKNPAQNYQIYTKVVRFIIDGMDLDFFYFPLEGTGEINQRLNYIRSYLDYFTAEDITGIEVMFNPQYNSKYINNFVPELLLSPEPPPIAFIEITTRSKKGPFMKVIPGTYLYKPLAFTMPKQFYSPKYTVGNKNIALGTDMRSTLHWEPNVITNAEGKATVSFFTADKPANYTVTIEGVNLEGNLGYKMQQLINIKTP